MSFDSPRIAELRRRVQADPASIAFAQLAEEYRRAGRFEEAVEVGRAGLARHPSYLSARVTLGRALIELGHLDEAEAELDLVLRAAPDNLAAIRGRAEIHQSRGQLEPALDFYKRALDLAHTDPVLERTVRTIGLELDRATAPERVPEPSAAVPDAQAPPAPAQAFDFDELLAALGGDTSAVAPDPGPSPTLGAAAGEGHDPAPDLDRLAEEAEEGDELAGLELQLRASEARPAARAADDFEAAGANGGSPVQTAPAAPTPSASRSDDGVLHQLEAWLAAIRAGRRQDG